uniref:Uncharacterized protein n=1 Tax=Aegilops tauschii subsp. strangulata TaxID=200361 RepID=A0A453FBD3_AEGTS
KNQIGDGEKQGEDARNKASTPTAQRHAAPPRRQPPGPPRRRRRRSPLLLPHRARLPVRSSPAAAAPRLRLPQRLGTSAAAPLLALALHLACPRLRGRGVRLRGGGEARDLHGGRAALRARARHRVAARALEAPKRNHPLMLLSGVATNAVGFDLSPGASFARHMSMQGFDTWIVELRGAGLSTRGSELAAASTKSDMSSNSGVDKILTQKVNVVPPTKDMLTNEPQSSEVPVLTDTNVLETNTSEEPQLVTKLANALAQLSVTFSGYVRDSQLRSITDSFFDRVTELVPDASLTSLEEVADKFLGLMELPQTSAIYDQISQLSQRLVKILGEGQQNVSPRLFGWQERLSATIEDLQKQLELIISYDWDFDHYLEEDVPAAVCRHTLYCREIN